MYLLRHGDVDYFDGAGRPFRPNGVSLNAEGEEQARAAAELLAGVSFDRALSSDLPRCVETARILLGSRFHLLETNATLREIQPGRLADIPSAQMEQAFLDAFAGGLGPETRFLAGETFASLCQRVRGWLLEALGDPGWKNLLVVAHGGVNRVILAEAFGRGFLALPALEQDAGCINIIDWDEKGKGLVRLVNYTPYNPAKHGMELTSMERIYGQFQRRATGEASHD
jgi:probable phosphoglycerate mutase